MIRVLLFSAFLLAAIPAISQKPKENTPTQKEMEDMMKEAQKMMEQMNRDDKKMMDSMGIKMPSLKDVPKIGDKQLAEAYEDEMRIVPKKDVTRISLASQQTVTAATLLPYLQKIHTGLLNLFTVAEKSMFEEAYNWIVKKTGGNKTAISNGAAQLWMMGKFKAAIYVMGKLLSATTEDTNAISNYAAFLTMAGAEEKALPVLNYLNKVYPKNSTILNNISQAWFGLGEIDKAGKYADSTVRICAWHPQANVVKAKIAESKGDKSHAVEAVKASIHKVYSSEKEDMLRQLDSKLDGDDISWPFPKKYDALGLEAFKHPDFPMSVGESIALEPIWKQFRETCDEKINALEKQYIEVRKKSDKQFKGVIDENMAMIRASQNAGRPLGVITAAPLFAKKATLKLKQSMDGNGGFKFKVTKASQDIADHMRSSAPLYENYKKEIEKWTKIESDEAGEGLPNRSYCRQKKDAADNYLKAFNSQLQVLDDKALRVIRDQFNEQAYWDMYILWPEQYEAAKLQYKIAWLKELRGLKFESITEFKCAPLPGMKPGQELPDFDDLHCKYKSTLKLVFGSIESNCSKITTKLEIDIQGVKLFEAEMKQDDKNIRDSKDWIDYVAQSFTNCTIAIGPSKSAEIGTGPFKLEAEIGAKGILEFDRNGLSDVGVKLEAEIKATAAELENLPGGGTKALDPTIEMTLIGAETKITFNTGFTAEGKGILKVLNSDNGKK